MGRRLFGRGAFGLGSFWKGAFGLGGFWDWGAFGLGGFLFGELLFGELLGGELMGGGLLEGSLCLPIFFFPLNCLSLIHIVRSSPRNKQIVLEYDGTTIFCQRSTLERTKQVINGIF